MSSHGDWAGVEDRDAVSAASLDVPRWIAEIYVDVSIYQSNGRL